MIRRFSLSLVELTIAMLILLTGLGVFTSGYLRGRKDTDFRQAARRIKELCSQASRFSTLTGRQGRVILRKKGEEWSGYLSLIGPVEGESDIRKLTKRQTLKHIDSIKFDSSLLAEVQLLFYSRRGLYSIEAKDSYEKKIPLSGLGEFDDKIKELNMVVVPKVSSLSSVTIDLKPFITTVHNYAPISSDTE